MSVCVISLHDGENINRWSGVVKFGKEFDMDIITNNEGTKDTINKLYIKYESN